MHLNDIFEMKWSNTRNILPTMQRDKRNTRCAVSFYDVIMVSHFAIALHLCSRLIIKAMLINSISNWIVMCLDSNSFCCD